MEYFHVGGLTGAYEIFPYEVITCGHFIGRVVYNGVVFF